MSAFIDYFLVNYAEFKKLGAKKISAIADSEGSEAIPCFTGSWPGTAWDGSSLIHIPVYSALEAAIRKLPAGQASAVKETIDALMEPVCDDLGLAEYDWPGSFSPTTVQRMWKTAQQIDLSALAEVMHASAPKEMRAMLVEYEVNIENHLRMYLDLLKAAAESGSGLVCLIG